MHAWQQFRKNLKKLFFCICKLLMKVYMINKILPKRKKQKQKVMWWLQLNDFDLTFAFSKNILKFFIILCSVYRRRFLRCVFNALKKIILNTYSTEYYLASKKGNNQDILKYGLLIVGLFNVPHLFYQSTRWNSVIHSLKRILWPLKIPNSLICWNYVLSERY